MSYFVTIALKLLEVLPWDKLIDAIVCKFGKTEKVINSKIRFMNEVVKREDKKNWLDIARSQIGVTEIPGPKNEKKILEYHASTSLKATLDSVPWCSSFVNWVMIQAGRAGTNNARARSWMEWGEEIEVPFDGCIVVFWRKSITSRSGHVGFYVGEDGDSIRVLGGNQSNQVKISSYPRERLLGYFKPE